MHILRHNSRYFSDTNLLSYGFIFHFQSTFKHFKRFFLQAEWNTRENISHALYFQPLMKLDLIGRLNTFACIDSTILL